MAVKITSLEMQYRVSLVADMIAGGMHGNQAVKQCWERWHIRERQAWQYVQRARELLTTGDAEAPQYWLSVSLRRYEDIYQRAMAGEQYRIAIQAQERIDALRGLGAAQAGVTQVLAFLPDARVMIAQGGK